MQATLSRLGIDRMSMSEKIDLIGDIWDSISRESGDVSLTGDQKREVDRRLAAHKANLKHAIPWETIESFVSYRFSGDELRLCSGKEGQKPRGFTAAKGTGQSILVLKREQSR